MKNLLALAFLLQLFFYISCKPKNNSTEVISASYKDTFVDSLNLPQPFATESATKKSKVIGWHNDKKPIAPVGFQVSKFVDNLDHPRWIYVADNGDVFIAEANSPHSVSDKLLGKNQSPNSIIMLRDSDKDGTYESKTEYLKGLNKPFGMVIINDHFYVANTDAVIRFPYQKDSMSITDKGTKIISLPGNERHWTRNIVTNKNKDKFYVSVGSSTNVAEKGIEQESRRACILEFNIDGTGEKLYASGLRNPVGMDWAPGTNTLWTTVNERDELGDELVPDYLTSVKENGFYGWPYSYFGQHIDPRLKDNQRPDLVKKAIVPDMALGAHTASLGLAFYTGNTFPAKYKNGAFIGQHGSWNRSSFVGYKVVFVPFNNGKPSGKAEDFLTGFIANEAKSEVYGRPVGVAVLKDGSLLVADDDGNMIWRVTATK